MVNNDALISSIFDISQRMKESMTFDSQTSHLTLLQIQTLIYLRSKKDVQMKDIATSFDIKMPTATSLLNRLTKSGLVRRKIGREDKRVVKILLTRKGKRLLDRALIERRKKIKRLLFFLSDKDKKALFRMLKVIEKFLDEQYEK